MPIFLGPDRDKNLGIKNKDIEKRVKANEKLNKKLEDIANFLAEGHSMAYGTSFDAGSDLAYLIFESLRFSIATLQETGYLSKRLPKKADNSTESVDNMPGQYI